VGMNVVEDQHTLASNSISIPAYVVECADDIIGRDDDGCCCQGLPEGARHCDKRPRANSRAAEAGLAWCANSGGARQLQPRRLFSRQPLRTPHASIPPAAHIMAPLTDSAVDELKGTVSRLEQRIAELESRLQGQVGVADPSQESVRMILMGPPGAGTW
jgi:hypothetical protein